jgi:hypothetical protein
MEKTVTLKYPLEYEKDGIKQTISEIKIIRLKARHLKSLPSNMKERKEDATLLIPILSCMTAIPENVLEELDLVDFTTLAQEIQSFL